MSDARRLIQPRRRDENLGPHLAELPDELPAQTEAEVQLAAVGLWKRYHKGRVDIPVLRGVDLEVRRGEFVSIIGQSGSGKSTLLHLLGMLDVPDEGEIAFRGQRIDNLPMRKRDALRNHEFGMIFQFYHLLPELTALENVLSPLLIAESVLGYVRHRKQHVARATELLEMVGLGHRIKHRPGELSGGEMQRAAIARALASEPEVLLADEPTGNLDSSTGEEILRILRTLNGEHNLTIVMVTHDLAIAAQADRRLRLAGGQMELA
ncbi:MAG: ABC transporter ATP-binding protein [Planctomycetota bacterium]|nr:MAG: ABC transporter ATP-binding protein [Planctomycetota bacterium]